MKTKPDLSQLAKKTPHYQQSQRQLVSDDSESVESFDSPKISSSKKQKKRSSMYTLFLLISPYIHRWIVKNNAASYFSVSLRSSWYKKTMDYRGKRNSQEAIWNKRNYTDIPFVERNSTKVS